MKNILYLAGAIHNYDDPISWRKKATSALAHRWFIIDPTNDAKTFAVDEVVRYDLRNVRRADMILAKVDVPSWGTAMELFAAHTASVPVVAFAAPRYNDRSPWLHCHVKKFYSSLDEAIKALR